MAKMYYESDADMSLLDGMTVGVIGYGSQGHAHALNLKESGVDVVVGLYEGSRSKEKAEGDGLRVELVADAAAGLGHRHDAHPGPHYGRGFTGNPSSRTCLRARR